MTWPPCFSFVVAPFATCNWHSYSCVLALSDYWFDGIITSFHFRFCKEFLFSGCFFFNIVLVFWSLVSFCCYELCLHCSFMSHCYNLCTLCCCVCTVLSCPTVITYVLCVRLEIRHSPWARLNVLIAYVSSNIYSSS